jgi:uncharacterized membrane protein (DUF2068 family)
MRRPTGVTILGVLTILAGIWGILWGLAVTGFGGLSWLTGAVFSQYLQSWGGAAFWAGLLTMAVGVLQLITAGGLFGLKSWAWLLAAIGAGLTILSPILGILNGSFWSLFGLIIPGIILFYLMSADVRRAFGRA